MSSVRLWWPGALALAALSACSLVPPLERPSAPVAAQWPASAGLLPAGGASAAELPWQQFVPDAALREAIDLALQNNRDLRVALQAIEQTRAQYQIRRADELPTLGLNAGASRSAPNAMAAFGAPSVASSYSVGLGVAAWELDFFGRVAALKDVALANHLASEEALRTAQLSLIASVASTWLQLKADTELLALSERTLATREASLKLTRLRFDHGVASGLDLRLAESSTASAQATRAQQVRLRAQDVNLLTLLVGQPLPEHLLPPVTPATGARAPSSSALPAFAEVSAGLPSDLLLRRPDVRAAEQQLIAANANIGAARANFFPRIALTTSLGRVSPDLDGLLGSGGSKAWSFGPSITLPIFDAGRNQANLDAARAAREGALAQYEKTIQTAFREVADALAGRATWADQVAALQAQAETERDRLRLTDLRYRSGVANQLDLLDAERSLFTTEQALVQAQLAQRANDVQLYKALGGGWNAATPVAERR